IGASKRPRSSPDLSREPRKALWHKGEYISRPAIEPNPGEGWTKDPEADGRYGLLVAVALIGRTRIIREYTGRCWKAPRYVVRNRTDALDPPAPEAAARWTGHRLTTQSRAMS